MISLTVPPVHRPTPNETIHRSTRSPAKGSQRSEIQKWTEEATNVSSGNLTFKAMENGHRMFMNFPSKNGDVS